MKRKNLRPTLAGMLAVAIGLLVAITADAREQSVMETLWVDPAGDPATFDLAARRPGLLTTPAGWMPPDAAVLLLGDGTGPSATQDRLIAALLEEAAAVLELDVLTPRGVAADNGHNPPPPTVADLLPDLVGGLLALRQIVGAGPVVVLGFGTTGAAALRAIHDPTALQLAGDERGFNAAGSLGPDGLRFAAGIAPEPQQDWPGRVKRFCGAVAYAVRQPSADAACTAALVPVGTVAAHAGRHAQATQLSGASR